MLKFGGWNVDVPRKQYPQKIASVIDDINKYVGLGASYEAIAYLGTQIVGNSTNHAVLAQQTVMNGKDTKNAVVLIINEKPGIQDVSVIDIRRIVESGEALGGTKVNITTDIPQEAKEALDTVFEGWCGAEINPFAFIGTQVVKGTNYIFAADLKVIAANENLTDVAIVIVNPMTKSVSIERIFEFGVGDNEEKLKKFGYAFTWLKKPLGEWP